MKVKQPHLSIPVKSNQQYIDSKSTKNQNKVAKNTAPLIGRCMDHDERRKPC